MLKPGFYQSIRLIASSLGLKPINIADDQVVRPDLKSLTSVDSIVSQLGSVCLVDNSVSLSQSFFFVLFELSLAFAAVVYSGIRCVLSTTRLYTIEISS